MGGVRKAGVGYPCRLYVCPLFLTHPPPRQTDTRFEHAYDFGVELVAMVVGVVERVGGRQVAGVVEHRGHGLGAALLLLRDLVVQVVGHLDNSPDIPTRPHTPQRHTDGSADKARKPQTATFSHTNTHIKTTHQLSISIAQTLHTYTCRQGNTHTTSRPLMNTKNQTYEAGGWVDGGGE